MARVRSVLPSFCCVTVVLDSFAGTSHSEQVTHVIRYLKRAEQRYSRIVATRSWAPDGRYRGGYSQAGLDPL